jgi:hypothetical protein
MPLGFGPGRPATPSPQLACTEPGCPPLETVVVGSPVAALTWAGSHLLITAHRDGRVRAHSVPSRAARVNRSLIRSANRPCTLVVCRADPVMSDLVMSDPVMSDPHGASRTNSGATAATRPAQGPAVPRAPQ